MEKNRTLFQYRDLKAGYRAVSLNSRLSDYERKIIIIKGEPTVIIPEMAIKDCRKIDGCVYLAPKDTPETEMNELIETFNKLLNEKNGWVSNQHD